jgi:uncharacterized membrane protein
MWLVFMSYVLSFIYIGIYWNKLQYGSHPSIPTEGRTIERTMLAISGRRNDC